ncbi:MAG: hypothetical protein AAGH81_19180, partial [Bacteroidota bacterium]
MDVFIEEPVQYLAFNLYVGRSNTSSVTRIIAPFIRKMYLRMKPLCSIFQSYTAGHSSGSMRQLKNNKKYRIKIAVFRTLALCCLAMTSLKAQNQQQDSTQGK